MISLFSVRRLGRRTLSFLPTVLIALAALWPCRGGAVVTNVSARGGFDRQLEAQVGIGIGNYTINGSAQSVVLGVVGAGWQNTDGLFAYPDGYIGSHVVSSSGGGASLYARKESRLIPIGARYMKYTTISLELNWPGGGYSDDATLVWDPPRRQDLDNAMANTSVTEIVLGEGLFYHNAVISRDLIVRGAGMGRTYISGARLGSVFRVNPGVNFRLEDVTLMDGLAPSGGGIYNEGTTTVIRCEIQNCRAYHYLQGEGGGIFNRGGSRLVITDSTLHGNIASARGGAICSSGLNLSTLPAPTGTGQASSVISGTITNLAGLTPPVDASETNLQNFADQAEVITANQLTQLRDPRDYFTALMSNPFTDFTEWLSFDSPVCVISNTVITGNRVGRGNVSAYIATPLGNVRFPRLMCMGGGVHNDLGLLLMDGCTISSNEVASDFGNFGGGISTLLGVTKVERTRMSDNRVDSTTVLSSGGAMYNLAAYAQLFDADLVSNNVSALFLSSGGGIKNTSMSRLDMTRTRIAGNTSGGGGGVANDYGAHVVGTDCQVMSNTISGVISANGAGLRNEDGGTIDLDRCAIHGNTGSGKVKGGGLYNQCTQYRLGDVVPVILASRMTLRNCTISENRLLGRGTYDVPLETRGAGLYNGSFDRGLAELQVYSCTIVSNSGSGGLVNSGGGIQSTGLSEVKTSVSDNIPGTSRVYLANSIFSGNLPEDVNNAISSSMTSRGYNFDGDGSGANACLVSDQALASAARFRTVANPGLARLQMNGGFTPTHGLLAGSAAIDQGAPDGTLSATLSPVDDQRGLTRAVAGRRDVGAYEAIVPSGVGETYTTYEDMSLNVPFTSGVLVNDYGLGPQALLVASPSNGTVNLSGDGAFIYQPAADFRGTNTFSYRLVDVNGVTGPVAQAVLVVKPRLDWLSMVPPVGTNLYGERHTNLTLTFDENITSSDVLANVQLAGSRSGPVNFTAAVNAATAKLYPARFFDKDETVTVTVRDGMKSAIGSPIFPAFSRTYRTYANRAPVPGPAETFSVPEEGVLNVALPSTLLANDSDPDRDAISVLPQEITLYASYWDVMAREGRDTNATAVYVGTYPSGSWAIRAPVAAHHGLLNLNTNGTFDYTPETNFTGTDYFDYVLSDNELTSAMVRVNINVTPMPDPPVGQPDFYGRGALNVNAAEGLLANDSDIDNDVLAALLVTPPLFGSLHLQASGAFTYTPGLGGTGGDIFFYRLTDGIYTTAPLRVKLGNSPPVATPDAYAPSAGTTLVVSNPAASLLANDVDPDQDTALTARLESPPTHGAVAIQDDGSFVYTPSNGYVGTDSFWYRASDGQDESMPGLVKLGNTAPVAAADNGYELFLNTTLTVAVAQGVLANDSDADGDPLTVALKRNPTNGVVNLAADGSFSYAPNAGFTGSDSFTYVAHDPVTTSTVATVTINVFDVMRVVSFSPLLNAHSTPTNGPFQVFFSQLVSSTGVAAHVRLHGSFSGARTFTAGVSSNRLTVTPSTPFKPGERVSLSLLPGIKSTGFFQTDAGHTATYVTEVLRGGAYFTSLPAGSTSMPPAAVAAGDLNGDGLLDALIVNDAKPPQVLMNQGGRVFSNRVETLGVDWTYTLGGAGEMADFNGDGRLDVAISAGYSSKNYIGLNLGNGTFVTSSLPYPPDAISFMKVADFDADGDFDIAAIGFDSLWLWRNDGTGQFAVDAVTNAFADLSNFVQALAAGDVDGDGDTDLYVGGFKGDQLYLNNGDGSFVRSDTLLDTFMKDAVELTDLDGDSDLDLLAGPDLGRAGTIWINDGFGNFTRSVYEFGGNVAYAIAVGDFDGDRDADLFHRGGNVPTWLNDGAARFASAGQTIPSTGTLCLAVGDFDNDGDLDVFNPRGSSSAPLVPEVWYNQTPPRVRDDLYAANGTNPVVTTSVTGVLSNDTPGDAGVFVAVLASNALRGTLTLSTNGAFTYTPGTNFTGSDVFFYRAVDSVMSSRVVRVKIGNGVPVAVADTNYLALNDVQLRVEAPGVLANDTDPEGDPLQALLAAGPTNGTLLLRGDGSFLYSAATNFAGIDSFTYRATDGFATSAVVTVRLDIRTRLTLVSSSPRVASPRAAASEDAVLKFNRSLKPASVTSSVFVAGGFTGARGITRTVTGDTLRLDPTNDFRPGEKVSITLSADLEGLAGERQSVPRVLEYQVEAPFGRGLFTDSGQRIGSYGSSSVAAGDFDRDGDIDVAVGPARQFSSAITNFVPGTGALVIWTNNGTGVFSDSGQRLGDLSTSGLTAADLDLDGALDLVADEVVYFNNGTGRFTNSVSLLGSNMVSLVGDVNGDRWPDVLLYNTTNLAVWVNNGSGGFTNNPAAVAQLNFVNLRINKPALGDLNGDGSLDLFIVPFFSSDPMKVWFNNGDGIFTESGQVFGNGGDVAQLADIDQDGDLDAVTPNGTPNGGPMPMVYFNRGDGVFTPGTQLHPTNLVRAAALGDADGDGDLDLFALQTTGAGLTNTTTLYLNDGFGTFSPSGQLMGDSTLDPTNGTPSTINRNVVLADFNNDGALDVWIAVDRLGLAWTHQIWMNQAVLAPVEGGLAWSVPDSATAAPFTNLVVRGPTNVSLTITVDGIHKGLFTTSSLAAGGFTGPISNVYSRSAGTPASAQAALRQLVYAPTPNRLPVGTNEATLFTIRASSGPVVRTNSLAVVNVTSVNDAPVAVNDAGPGFTGPVNVPLITASVLSNDVDVDFGDVLTLVTAQVVTVDGTISNLGNGVFSYTAPSGYVALAAGVNVTNRFTYVVRDAQGATAAATVMLVSQGVNDPPRASNDTLRILKNAGLQLLSPLLVANDSDPDNGDAAGLTISGVMTNGTRGRVYFDPVGGVGYDPSGAFSGLGDGAATNTTFQYVLRDAAGATSTATVTIQIIGADEAPIAVPDAFVVTENAAETNVTARLLANDYDPDLGQTAALFITEVDTAGTIGLVTYSNGVVTYAPSGRFDWLPAGQSTNDVFSYRIRGNSIGTFYQTPVASSFLRGTGFVDVVVSVSSDGRLNLVYGGVTIFTNVALPDFEALREARFAFGARTGGANQQQDVDDVTLQVNTGALALATYDFSSGAPTGSLLLGSAVATNGSIRLTAATNNQTGSLLLPVITGSNAVSAFTASFKLRMSGGTVPPADGMSFVWGTGLSTNTAFGEIGAGYGLAVSFDIYDNGNGEAPAIDVRWRTVSSTGLVTVTVQGQNDPPVPAADVIALRAGAPASNLTSVILANDVDPDRGETASLALSGITGTVAYGVVTFTNGLVTYLPLPQPCLLVNESVSDTFTCLVRDVQGAVVASPVTVYVLGTNVAQAIAVTPNVSYNFNTNLPPELSLYGTAFRDPTNGLLVLTTGTGNQNGHLIVAAPDATAVIAGFVATFQVWIDQASALPADGFSLNWAGDITNGVTTQAEEGTGSGLSVCLDLYDNGGVGEAPAIDLKWGGTLVARRTLPIATLVAGSNLVEVAVKMSPDGTLDMLYNCQQIFSRQVVTGFVPQVGARFSLAARTGGSWARQRFDNLNLQIFGQPPVRFTGLSMTNQARLLSIAAGAVSNAPDLPVLYRYQRSTDLVNWVDVGPVILMPRSTETSLDTNAAPPRAFYRSVR